MNDVAIKEETELARPETTATGFAFLEMQHKQLQLCWELAVRFCNTDMVPKGFQGKPEAGAVAIQWGAEIGLAPLQALQNIAVINGSPTMWGDALVALVQGSEVCEDLDVKWNEETQTATATTTRKGRKEKSYSFSVADAQKANLTGKNNWKHFAKRMCENRARAFLIRNEYADLIKGLQVREIVQEDIEAGHVERDITPVKTESDTLNTMLEAPKAEDVQDAILESTNTAELKEAGELINGMPEGEEKEECKDVWMKRQAALKDLHKANKKKDAK